MYAAAPTIQERGPLSELKSRGAPPATQAFVRRSSGLVRQISAGDALVGNILLVNLVAAAATLAVVPFTFPGASMPLAVLLAMIPALALATIYVLFGMAMPRSGGEYVYVSRALHPAIGFAANFSFVGWNVIFGGLLANWISTVYLSSFFASLGWQGGADFVSHKGVAFLIGLVAVLATALVVVPGVRFAMRLMKGLFYAGMAGLVVTLVVVAVRGHDAFVRAVDRQGSYDGILSAAKTAGFRQPTGWTQFTPTIEAVALISLATLFVMFSSYAGGEVRNARRSVPVAIYGAAVLGGLAILLMALTASGVWGNEFIAASNYLSANAPEKYTLDASPSFAFLAGLAGGDLVVVIANLGFICLILGNMIFGWVTLSRCLFAWSFDRIMPRALSRVSPRTHTPVAALATLFVAFIAALAWYTIKGNVAVLGGATMGFISTFLTVSLAAIVFPYARREIYRGSPADRSVLGIPLLTLAGAATFVMLAAMMYAFLSNDTFGANGGQGLLFFGGLWVIGLIVFLVARTVQMRQGVPFDVAFRELPSE
jgi:APA family basic amino acid/polyamine antiporter